MASLTTRYSDNIHGVISCYDRIIIQGTLPNICYAAGITHYFYEHGLRIFDYKTFAKDLNDQIRENAQRLATEAGIKIEFIPKATTRKEALVKTILESRGTHPGLVCIFSAMEICDAYQPWHDKRTNKTFLKSDSGKCLHYYFYLIHETLGLVHVRVPTWCPFRLQIYFNGHNRLAAMLRNAGISFSMLENAFLNISDLGRAQELSDNFDVARFHIVLDELAARFCPVTKTLDRRYHWSIMQAEYATDILFKDRESLAAIYGNLTRTAIHTVKPEKVATFLGRKLSSLYLQELGNDFSTRTEGTCVKHHMGPASIKMYDKFGIVLRIETTVNNVSFFKHYRMVEQRDGNEVRKLASMKKSIYSLPDLDDLCQDANRRYLEFLSEIDDPSAGQDDLNRVSSSRSSGGRSFRGLNFFSEQDYELLLAVARGEHLISGLRSKDIHCRFPDKNPGWISRSLKRLRIHGIIRRIGKTYKYYLTSFGKRIIATGTHLKELFLIPHLAASSGVRS